MTEQLKIWRKKLRVREWRLEQLVKQQAHHQLIKGAKTLVAEAQIQCYLHSDDVNPKAYHDN